MRLRDVPLATVGGGLNEGIAPNLIKENELSEVRNFLPRKSVVTDLEKVKLRSKDFIRANNTLLGSSYSYNSGTGVISSMVFTTLTLYYVNVGDTWLDSVTGQTTPVLAVDYMAGTVTVAAGKVGWAVANFQVKSGFSLNDDRYYESNTVNPALWNVSKNLFPSFDNLDQVFYFQTNNWSPVAGAATTQAYAVQGVPFYPTAGTATCNLGIYLTDFVTITTTKGVFLSIPVKMVGAYDAAVHIMTATLYSVSGRFVGSVTAPVVTKSTSTSYFQRLEFCFLSSGTPTTRICPGEYRVELSTSTCTAAKHYELAYGGNPYNLFGWAVQAANTARCHPLAEVAFYSKKGATSTAAAQDDVVLSASMFLRARGTSAVYELDVEHLLWADRHSIFALKDDRYYANGTAVTRNGGTLYNSWNASAASVSFDAGSRWACEIQRWTTYNNHLIAGTKFGLGIMKLCASDASASPTYVPDIGKRTNSVYATYTGYSVAGTGYAYNATTGALSALVLSAGRTIYDIAAGDTFSDTGSGATATVLRVDYAGGIVYVRTGITGLSTTNFTVVKHPDVFQPAVTAVAVANIMPGRVYLGIGKTLKWSGGTDVEEIGDLTQFNTFAELDFGDGSDRIYQLAYWNGLLFIFTVRGKLYWMSGEPPVDPTQSLGTIRPDGGIDVGTVGSLEQTQRGDVFFTTANRRGIYDRVWRLAGSLQPEVISTGRLKNLNVTNLRWDEHDQRLWAWSQTHVVSSYNTTASNDATQRYIYSDGTTGTSSAPTGGLSYVWDSGANTWSTVSRVLDGDTDTQQPTPFVDGKTCWRVGCFIHLPLSTNYYAFYGRGQVAGDDQVTPNLTAPNDIAAENATARLVSSNAHFVTREYTFNEIAGMLNASGQIDSASLYGDVKAGTTATVSVVDSNDVVTSLGVIAGDGVFSGVTMRDYLAEAGANDVITSFRLRYDFSGPYSDIVRRVGVSARVSGKKVKTL